MVWRWAVALHATVAWDVVRHNQTFKAGQELGSLDCPAQTIVLGCACSGGGKCTAIQSSANGCSFSFQDSIVAQIACGNISNATSWFAYPESPSGTTASCGAGIVTDCLWNGTSAVDGVVYNQSTRECQVQSLIGASPIAICMKWSQDSTWNVTASLGAAPHTACPANARLLGCQCAPSKTDVCENVVVTGDNCTSSSNTSTWRFCIEDALQTTLPVPNTGCPLTSLPSYLVPVCKLTDWLPDKESCEIRCRDGNEYHLWGQSAVVTCENGTLSALPNLGCPEGVEVQFEMELESITCGVDLDNATIRLLVVEGLLSVARNALGFPNERPRVLSTTPLNSSGVKCNVWFDQSGDAAAFSKWASVSNATRSFNLTSVLEGDCEVVVTIRNVALFFESLFTFLSDLPAWVLFVCVALLLLALVVFLFVNRASEHPFAVLGAIVSIINVASKAVFINFLFRTSDTLSAVGIPDKFFVDASIASVCVLALAFLFNFVVTVRLFTVHYEKNAHDFGPWWAKHRLGVAVVLILCGLNPASFLILCSSTFNSELCKGPVSLQAQKRFQVMGLISVLLVDIPFVCIQILAYIEVVSSSVLAWSGGASSVVLGMCFSLVSIALGLVRRTCAVCIAKHPKAKLSQAEMTSS